MPHSTSGENPDEIVFANACPPGTSIADLTLHEAIGQGGEGIVYRATWRGRAVLAKEYHPSVLASRVSSGHEITVQASRSSWQVQYRKALERFVQLGERLRALPPHQNIVRVHDVVEGMRTAFLVMDEVHGPPLDALLDYHGTCTAPQAFHLADQLSSSLAFLERENLIHRDISPDNIIVSDPESWSIVLIDFNAAKVLSVMVTQSTAGLVKPGYTALEQYDSASDSDGIVSDIYSSAAVLYRAITGAAPPDASRRAYRDDHRTLTDMAPDGYDHAFLAAIDHGLQVRSEDRPQSAAAWRGELGLVYVRDGARAAPKQSGDHKAPPPPPPAAPRAAPQTSQQAEEMQVPLRRFQFPIGIIVIVAAVLLAIGWTLVKAPEIIAIEKVEVRAAAALAGGDLNRARELFEQVLLSDPDNQDAFFGMVNVLLRANDPKLHARAIAMLKEGWLTDDQRKEIDKYLTSDDRQALAGGDLYGTIGEADSSNNTASDPSKQSGEGVPRRAAESIDEKYGTMPDSLPSDELGKP